MPACGLAVYTKEQLVEIRAGMLVMAMETTIVDAMGHGKRPLAPYYRSHSHA